MAKLTKERYWSLYKQLPDELKEALFSIEDADEIAKICEDNGITGETTQEVSKEVGNVLFGLSTPEDFYNFLIRDLQIPQATARKMGHDINRQVFFPVRAELQQVHNMKLTSQAQGSFMQSGESTPKEEPLPLDEEPPPPSQPRGPVLRDDYTVSEEEPPAVEEKSKKQTKAGPDPYRESVGEDAA